MNHFQTSGQTGRLVLVVSCLLTACGSSAEELVPRVDSEAGVTADAAESALSTVRYASRVVSYTKGDKGGFNEDKLPGIVLGGPHGGGCCAGSVDVLSLGDGGEIVLGFDSAIVDGPGVDFVVFENPFEIGGDPTSVTAEPAEVSVSTDGVTWTAFPCKATAWPYGMCAGWHPVHASPESPIDPRDPDKAGGDRFDLSAIGVKAAQFVRIRDMRGRLPAASPTGGFDLDAVAVLHSAR